MKKSMIVLVLVASGSAAFEVACSGSSSPSPLVTVSPPPVFGQPASSGTARPAPAPTLAWPRPRFRATIARLDTRARARMRYSWRPGCPVGMESLRLVTLSFWGFDQAVHLGELVVHHDVAPQVLEVFAMLFRARFPIRRMVLTDVYGGDDDRSMAANNTSAFNCRAVTGGTAFSEHSYGRAIDVNPLLNPYVAGGTVLPPAGARFVDRSLEEPGMIHGDDVVVRAFASVGWEWGGSWSNIKDYQHFSATGR